MQNQYRTVVLNLEEMSIKIRPLRRSFTGVIRYVVYCSMVQILLFQSISFESHNKC